MSVVLAAALAAALADCDAAVRAKPQDYQSYDCYRTVARIRHAWDGAVERLEALLARDAKNTMARVVLARIESDRGRERAEPLFRVAADEFASAKMPVGDVFARLDLAFLLRRQGRLDEAAAEVERARASATASGLSLLVANVRAEEAWIAEARADHGRAYALFRETEREVFPVGPALLQYSVLSGIGSTLWSMGRNGESLGYYRRLAALHEERGERYEAASDRYNIALLAGRLERDGVVSHEEYLRLRQQALDTAIENGNRGVESAIRQMIGGDSDEPLGRRIQETERALALAEEVGEEDKALFSLRELARLSVLRHRDRPEIGYRLADEAVRRGRATGDPTLLARGLIRRATLAWIALPRERALAESREALDAIERVRDLQRDDLIRARVASEWTHFYYMLSGLVLRLPVAEAPDENLEIAFSVMERLRGRVLLDALDAAQATPVLAHRGPVATMRGEILVRIGREQQRMLDRRLSAEEREDLRAGLELLEAQESVLRDALLRSDPAYAALRRPELPTLADVRRSLEPDQALLAFQVSDTVPMIEGAVATEGGSFVLVITRNAVTVHRLPDQRLLVPRVSLYLGLLGRRDGSDREGAASLRRDLLDDVLADLSPEVQRLILVPDKALFRVPFDALLEARYDVSIAPSAALWLRWRRAGERGARVPALVVADPELAASGLGPLPHARREARTIVRTLGAESKAVVGPSASEAYLASEPLDRYNIVHFGAHAVVDDAHPERSALVLAPGSPTTDGLLHVREIVGLDLRGAVVVLAACRSSAGTLLNGEGPMGLARGFFQAGARAVVGSILPVRDAEAEPFVSAFYEHLARGLSVGESMAQARRDRIISGAPAAAWAGWVVMGDASVVPVPGGAHSSWPWWGWVIAALVLVVGAVAVLARKNSSAR
jgi:tetratricopeptide (TPR) repeat protein